MLTVHQYNLQYYNQGDYDDCSTLIESSTKYPGSSLKEIASFGVPSNKLVIGKPFTSADATNGYMEPSKLGECVRQAQSQGWNGGIMTWQYRSSQDFPTWVKQASGQT